MARVFSEDAYSLGLLYAYDFAKKQMLLEEDLKRFHKTIEQNLNETHKDDKEFYSTLWENDGDCIYYPSEGKNGEIYYVLHSDFDYENANKIYYGHILPDIIKASLRENALNCIDLTVVDGIICRKEKSLEQQGPIRRLIKK